MTLFSRFSDHIDTALDALVARNALPEGLDRSAISVEPPRDPEKSKYDNVSFIGQARYEVFFHEGLHAVCHENRHNATLSDLRDDEEAVTLLSKFMVSYLRQTRDKFYK